VPRRDDVAHLFYYIYSVVESSNMFSNVNRKRIAAFKVLKFENVLHFSLEKYCRFQK
jgi:hypothetical protein